MTYRQPTDWTPTPTPAINPDRMQIISDDLNDLNGRLEAMNAKLDQIAPAPTQVICTRVTSRIWSLAGLSFYATGKIQVFLNGINRDKGTDWTELDPTAATFTFTWDTDDADRVDVLDWTARPT